MSERIPIMHTDCERVAFYYAEKPIAGTIIYYDKCTMWDGGPIDTFLPVMCESCGAHIRMDDLTWEGKGEVIFYQASSGVEAPMRDWLWVTLWTSGIIVVVLAVVLVAWSLR